jgi:hypothetical protein
MLSVVRLSARDAIIRPDKLRDYLLSVGHPDGRGKAEYLHRLGYSQDASGQLDADLREQILVLEAQQGRPSPYGQKHEILGRISPTAVAAKYPSDQARVVPVRLE